MRKYLNNRGIAQITIVLIVLGILAAIVGGGVWVYQLREEKENKVIIEDYKEKSVTIEDSNKEKYEAVRYNQAFYCNTEEEAISCKGGNGCYNCGPRKGDECNLPEDCKNIPSFYAICYFGHCYAKHIPADLPCYENQHCLIGYGCNLKTHECVCAKPCKTNQDCEAGRCEEGCCMIEY